MDYLNDLPERHPTHDTSEAAKSAFCDAIDSSGLFVIQQADRHDYGTDIHIEAKDGSSMTNLRVHVQLKGTGSETNADGSVSISVDRTNLNYLLSQPDSIYVCYHLPSRKLLARYAADVLREYEHRGDEWHRQKTLTVRFSQPFDEAFQGRLHARTLAGGRATRNRRLTWATTPPDRVPSAVKESIPAIDVPDDATLAAAMLKQLEQRGYDDVISHSFDQFAAVVDNDTIDFLPAYLAEINKGINGMECDAERIRKATDAIESAMKRREIHPGSGLYCLGNAWLALKDYTRAKDAYRIALEWLTDPRVVHVAAQCCKNCGSLAEAEADWNTAKQFYEKALTFDPDLGEAHFALALWYREHGNDLAASLRHFDSVIRVNGSRLQMTVIDGWRVEILFRLEQHDQAFREIRRLQAEADNHGWIWPWCAQQVAAYGKSTVASTLNALQFWRAYLRNHPDDTNALRERLFCLWRLRMANVPTESDFDGFKQAAEALIDSGDPLSALLCDRVGHWAQEDGQWQEAEKAYRRAYEHEPDRYGYCLGTALNWLGRYDEALELLLEQAQQHQPDSLSWFQVAIAREGVGDTDGSVEAYQKALRLDDDYELAWFNLGGVYWNAGKRAEAIETWTEALRRFPDHHLANTLRQKFPILFNDRTRKTTD